MFRLADTLKPYPAYKDSGVPWLGHVPAHWEVLPGRTVFREINDRNHPYEQMLSVTITRGFQERLLQRGQVQLQTRSIG